ICQRLVELMQSEIAVSSAPGDGSTFTVVLPFEAAAEQCVRSPPDLSQLDCIVVKSPDFNTDDLRIYLEHAGARVRVAADRATAAQAAASSTAQVVVIQDAGRDRVVPAALCRPFASA